MQYLLIVSRFNGLFMAMWLLICPARSICPSRGQATRVHSAEVESRAELLTDAKQARAAVALNSTPLALTCAAVLLRAVSVGGRINTENRADT